MAAISPRQIGTLVVANPFCLPYVIEIFYDEEKQTLRAIAMPPKTTIMVGIYFLNPTRTAIAENVPREDVDEFLGAIAAETNAELAEGQIVTTPRIRAVWMKKSDIADNDNVTVLRPAVTVWHTVRAEDLPTGHTPAPVRHRDFNIE